MRLHASLLTLAFVLGLAGGCASTENVRRDTPAPVVAELGSAPNCHVAGDVYTCGQPTPDDLAAFKAKGGKIVLTFRKPDEAEKIGYDEMAEAHRLGLVYVNIPWKSVDELTDERLDTARAVLSQNEGKMLVHCGSASRVGPIWLAWRVLDCDVDWDDALAEAKVVGMKSPEYEARVAEYVARREGGE